MTKRSITRRAAIAGASILALAPALPAPSAAAAGSRLLPLLDAWRAANARLAAALNAAEAAGLDDLDSPEVSAAYEAEAEAFRALVDMPAADPADLAIKVLMIEDLLMPDPRDSSEDNQLLSAIVGDAKALARSA